MKQKIKQTLMVIVGLLLSTTAFSNDFVVNGIYYNYIDKTAKTVEVTYRGSYSYDYSNEYTGSVTIPSSVTYSGTTYSVTTIGDYAFYNCTGLTEVTIGNSVTSIGSAAFYGCSGLTSITIPNSVNKIGEDAFEDCSGLTSVTIPNSVTSIGNYAFNGCYGLTEVNITDLSAWCKINFGSYDANPLYYAEKLKLNGTEIKDLVIPNDITEIKDYAFSYCTGLTSVTIPNSVTSIGEEAFEYCFDLETIVSLNPTPPACAGNNSFYSNNYSNATLYVPKDSFAKYFIDEVWGVFSNIKKIEILATSITLDKSSITLDKWATETIKATITPSNTTLSFLYWTSDNPIVATVDQSGKITAISAGTANITVMALDGSNVSASCKVIVNGTRIVLSQTEATLPVNDIMTLTYTITNSSNKTATWSTSNANVAPIKVNSDGSVTVVGMSDGVATITATANDGSGASASCVVTVGVGGIEGVEVDDNAIEVARYDIHGRLLSEPTRGINIVKMSDGTTRKEIIK